MFKFVHSKARWGFITKRHSGGATGYKDTWNLKRNKKWWVGDLGELGSTGHRQRLASKGAGKRWTVVWPSNVSLLLQNMVFNHPSSTCVLAGTPRPAPYPILFENSFIPYFLNEVMCLEKAMTPRFK